MGFLLQQKSKTLNDLQLCFVVRVMRIVTKWPRLKLRGFRYKVALYVSHLYIKFDDEVQRESLRISSIILD